MHPFEDNNGKTYYRIDRWYPPTDWIDYSSNTSRNIFKLDSIQQYFISMYHSCLILGIGELGPVNPNELLVAIICLLGSFALNSNFVGNISLLIHAFQLKETSQ
jgi:hypothetical protein